MGCTSFRIGLRLLGWLCTCAVLISGVFVVQHPATRLWHGIITHGTSTVPALAFTFDDGPHPLWSPLLADTLERAGAHGTFFLVGVEAQRYPELVARLSHAHHEIGNHSLTHPYPNLTELPAEQCAQEVDDAAVILHQLTGQSRIAFRPPGGGINDELLHHLRARAIHLAGWSRNIGDAGPLSPEVLLQRLVTSRRPGVILLLHQREHTVQALTQFLASPPASGYTYTTFTRISEVNRPDGEATRRKHVK